MQNRQKSRSLPWRGPAPFSVSALPTSTGPGVGLWFKLLTVVAARPRLLCKSIALPRPTTSYLFWGFYFFNPHRPSNNFTHAKILWKKSGNRPHQPNTEILVLNLCPPLFTSPFFPKYFCTGKIIRRSVGIEKIKFPKEVVGRGRAMDLHRSRGRAATTVNSLNHNPTRPSRQWPSPRPMAISTCTEVEVGSADTEKGAGPRHGRDRKSVV